MRAFFVTGTDTGVGKTEVAVALLGEAGRRGLRTAALKSAETGCELGPDGCLWPADAERLRGAATQEAELSVVCPFRYRQPAAPAVAARGEGQAPTLEGIRECVEALAAGDPDLLLVEGAGGLLVPVNDSMDMADLAAALGLALVVVARDGLGTINHTRLTVEVARARGLPVAAVVLNGAEPGTAPAFAASNARELQRVGIDVAGVVPHGSRDVATVLNRLLEQPDVPRGTIG